MSQLTIACLCAQWCNTCSAYASLFQQLKQDFPHAQLVWIDVEDQAALVDPIEVDNFPTVLIAAQGQAQFFGTVTPHLDTLRRLVQAHQTPATTPPCPPEVQALTDRLHQQHRQHAQQP